jgi:hypothetical protein
LNRSFEALCVRAGVRKVRFHDSEFRQVPEAPGSTRRGLFWLL